MGQTKSKNKSKSSKPLRNEGVRAHPFFGKKAPAATCDRAVAQAQAAFGGRHPDEMMALFQSHWHAGAYAQAKEVALTFTRVFPQVAQAWSDAAACCVHLLQWEEVVRYSLEALRLDPSILSAIDGLAHAYSNLEDYAQTRVYGQMALHRRDQQFGQKPYKPWEVAKAPSMRTDRGRNVIAFSLFGGNSKYCESAVINALEQPRLYPEWTCRFYVDETVPDFIKTRLHDAGAQVVAVDESMQHWPGPMWRFAAYDDPELDRVVFRDADSVISEREAGAVREWIESGLPFHAMRDSGSHCELLLAGLWGVSRGALPNMHEMVDDYLKVPPESMHFADQYFLREYVWPYARHHIMQHDSLFDFMQPRPFPDGPYSTMFHTGCVETTPSFSTPVNAPEGTWMYWTVWDVSDANHERLICRYPTQVKDGQVGAHLPRRYSQRIHVDYVVRIEAALNPS